MVGLTRTSYAQHQADNHQLPGWLRVALWAAAHANEHGHAPAYAGQLRRELRFTRASELSRAIYLAKGRRLIDATSSASCIVLPGHAIAPCEATHRGDTR